MKARDLEKVLYDEIPITQALGIKVQEVSEKGVILSAPLKNNVNHKNTAFGGSLYSISVLAGWGALYARLKSIGEFAHIVIQESEIKYLAPVTSGLVAVCYIDDVQAFDRSMQVFQRKGKARFALTATIANGSVNSVVFNGKYVIHR